MIDDVALAIHVNPPARPRPSSAAVPLESQLSDARNNVFGVVSHSQSVLDGRGAVVAASQTASARRGQRRRRALLCQEDGRRRTAASRRRFWRYRDNKKRNQMAWERTSRVLPSAHPITLCPAQHLISSFIPQHSPFLQQPSSASLPPLLVITSRESSCVPVSSCSTSCSHLLVQYNSSRPLPTPTVS